LHGNWVFVVVLEVVLHPLLLTASLEKSWVSRIFGDLLSYRTQPLTCWKQLLRLPSILVQDFRKNDFIRLNYSFYYSFEIRPGQRVIRDPANSGLESDWIDVKIEKVITRYDPADPVTRLTRKNLVTTRWLLFFLQKRRCFEFF